MGAFRWCDRLRIDLVANRGQAPIRCCLGLATVPRFVEADCGQALPLWRSVTAKPWTGIFRGKIVTSIVERPTVASPNPNRGQARPWTGAHSTVRAFAMLPNAVRGWSSGSKQVAIGLSY
jgi:hypothetical protein